MAGHSSRSDDARGPFDLSTTPIHLDTRGGPEHPALPLPDFGFDGSAFEAYTQTHCSVDAPGRLIMVETTPTSWPNWECHGEGDEVVIVLEGRADFIQEIDGETLRTPVVAGSAIINPAGVWHTADVQESMTAIYITPCPGTRHRAR